MENVLWLKIILVLVMVALTVIFGLLPVKVLKLLRKRAASATLDEQHRWPSLTLSLLTCFSGGVFLATCFLHLLPEVSDHFRQIRQDLDWDISYPIAELLSCTGFFLVFFLEEIVLLFLPGHAHGHGNETTMGDLKEKESASVNGSQAKDHASPAPNAGVNGCVSVVHRDSVGPLLNSANNEQHNHTNNTSVARNNTTHAHCTFNTTGRSRSPEKRRCRCATENMPLLEHDSGCELVRPRSIDLSIALSENERKLADELYLCDNVYCRGLGYGSLSSVKLDNHKLIKNPPHCHDSDACVSIELAEPERCELEICGGQDDNPPILMASRPHAHSHGVRSITFLLALSFHSVIEGLALGVQDEADKIAALFIAVMIHKSIVAFSVGLQLARTHVHQLRWVFIGVIALALMTPLGAGIGITVEASGDINEDAKLIVVMIFEGIGVGTFLYVTFFEILIHERDNEHPNLLKLAVILLGFAVIGALRIYESHEDIHSHGHVFHDHHDEH